MFEATGFLWLIAAVFYSAIVLLVCVIVVLNLQVRTYEAHPRYAKRLGASISARCERPINSSPSPFVLGVPLGESIRGLGKLF